MKSSKWLLWAIGLVVVVAVIALNRSRRTTSGDAAESSSSADSGIETSQPLSAGSTPPGETAADSEVGTPAPDTRMILVRPDMMLAEVNGVALTLRDLMPVSSSTPPELSIESDEYQALLQSAIERKLTFQVARSQRVVLSKEQTLQLEKARRLARAQKPDLSPEDAADYVARANFDTWKATTAMMQNALYAASEDLGRFVPQDQVDAWYKEHSNEFGALPEDPEASREARQRIDAAIRLQLAPGEDPEYQRALQGMMDALVSKADIKKHVE